MATGGRIYSSKDDVFHGNWDLIEILCFQQKAEIFFQENQLDNILPGSAPRPNTNQF